MSATFSLSKTIARAQTATVVAISATIVSAPRTMAMPLRTLPLAAAPPPCGTPDSVLSADSLLLADLGAGCASPHVALGLGDAPSPPLG